MRSYHRNQTDSTQAPIPNSGDLLVEQFRSAFMSLTAMYQAHFAAEQTEQSALQTLASIPSSNSMYVTPRDIPLELQPALAKTSVDAHLQKVQSEQIKAQATAIVQQLQSDADILLGKKVRVTVTQLEQQPVEVYWTHPQTGQYYRGNMHPRSFSGIIQDIKLGENVLIIKPRLARQIFTSKLAYYAVFPINPKTLVPMVQLNVG